MTCDVLADHLEMNVLWMSSGNTRSDVHIDQSENWNCLLAGDKRFVLMEWESRHEMMAGGEPDLLKRGYSLLDVDDVDTIAFPWTARVKHISCHVQAGDCIYIPALYFHQVRSPAGRNLAFNVWWRRPEEWNPAAARYSDLNLSTE